ncbi:uncharacterized protein JN550_007838 [Neoarthrinium moseri]|uniref:uncharacterized protein n=1 Tax=Neoarthrinium moseri TaxID=1658444 RepID=UPI001FDB82B6|nr:uncharacterized protein JN550_007838 [Neoarthrinium moseri]KAI1866149.1 hypothetical protein JN550_007838 [Neoarthrinium moseri]
MLRKASGPAERASGSWTALASHAATLPRCLILCASIGIENIAYVLGGLTATGGTIGFLKTGSIPSVAAGWTVGLLYGLGGYRLQNREPYGVELALLASVVLGGSSIPRAIRLRKPVPLVLSLVSLFGAYVFGDAFRKTL